MKHTLATSPRPTMQVQLCLRDEGENIKMKVADPEEENGTKKLENRERRRGIERVRMRENKRGKEDCLGEDNGMILRRRREKRKKRE